MHWKEIDQERVRQLFDYHDGNLIWKLSLGAASKGDVAGEQIKGYRRIKFDDQQYLAHRLIWVWYHGSIPENRVIDHIDRVKHNNRIENLRLATYSENAHNSQGRRNNTSGFKGVNQIKSGKWISRIRIDGVGHYLGTFDTPEAANEAYLNFSLLHYSP